MPRIAVAIFVVVAVSVSIGINIARYPAVFKSAVSTHESLVSNDTKDVSEAEETEGTVTVKKMSALPEENLAKWNSPEVRKVTPTVTEDVPYVASNMNYEGEESEPRTVDDESLAETEPSTQADDPSPETGRYEVEPYHPYTSQPSVQPSVASVDETPAGETTGPLRETSLRETSPSEEVQPNPATPSATLPTTPATPSVTPPATTEPGGPRGQEVPKSEEPGVSSNSPGLWPATVAETFRYSDQPEAKQKSFYARESQATVRFQNVSSAAVIRDESDWQVAAPEVSPAPAVPEVPAAPVPDEEKHANLSELAISDQILPTTTVKRLPAVSGADALPGALSPQRPIDYPVTGR